jgi:hypothetical protein
MNASGQYNLRCLDIAATNRKQKKPNRLEHGCTEKPEPPFASKAVLFSTLCAWIFVSRSFFALFLRALF